jgi:glycosyltransferase involved in cell wall biosynthesis
MISSKPLVSAILPVFNGGSFLVEALESIRKQNYDPLEIIVVDDGSTDNSAQVAAASGLDIHYIYQNNQGPAAARNTGLRISQGKLAAFLDADDLWPPGKLFNQVEVLLDHPEIHVVLGRTHLFGDLERLKNIDVFSEKNYTVIQPTLGSCVFRTTVFEKVGFYDETLRYGEDQDWFLRARAFDIRIALLDQDALKYRVHGGNMTRVSNVNDLTLARFLKKSLDRRRAGNSADVPPLQKFSQTLIILDKEGKRKPSEPAL